MNEVNGYVIPYDAFYMAELKDKLDIRADYINWIQQTQSHVSLLLNYPFISNTEKHHHNATCQAFCLCILLHSNHFVEWYFSLTIFVIIVLVKLVILVGLDLNIMGCTYCLHIWILATLFHNKTALCLLKLFTQSDKLIIH